MSSISKTLFDPSAVDLTKLGPKNQVEPEFYYYETSARPEIARVRTLLELWFASYPLEHQSELRQRIRASRSGIDSPFWELLLHRLLTEFGAAVTVHPAVIGSNRRPDFLVRLHNGFEFYIEAVLATGQTDAERAKENMVSRIYRTIDAKLLDERFFLSVEVQAFGKVQPPGNKLVYDLAGYLRGLKPEEVGLDLLARGFDTDYRFEWKHGDWHLEFIPIPRKQESIGKGHRAIGFYPVKVQMSGTKFDIRSAVEYKLDHHRLLTKPYVIAVNSTHWSTTEEDYIDALYGSESVVFSMMPDGSTRRKEERAPDGVWFSERGVRNDRLIGVLGVPDIGGVGPCSVASRSLTLYENPYIAYPSEATLEPLRRVYPDGVHLGISPGSSLGEILGLPPTWPTLKEHD